MVFRKSKAQSVTEYAILLGLAIAAFAGMQLYVKRSLNAKIKDASDAAVSAGAGSAITVGTTSTDAMGNHKQYEPYYTDSQRDTYSEDVSREQMNAGTLKKEIVSNVQATKGGGYSAEHTYANGTTADTQWDAGATK